MDENLDDLTDIYLGRCLKNWAASQEWRNRNQTKAAGEGRLRLLALAAALQPEQPVNLFRARYWWNRRLSFYPEDIFESQPFTQSRSWSLHLVENSFVYTC